MQVDFGVKQSSGYPDVVTIEYGFDEDAVSIQARLVVGHRVIAADLIGPIGQDGLISPTRVHLRALGGMPDGFDAVGDLARHVCERINGCIADTPDFGRDGVYDPLGLLVGVDNPPRLCNG